MSKIHIKNTSSYAEKSREFWASQSQQKHIHIRPQLPPKERRPYTPKLSRVYKHIIWIFALLFVIASCIGFLYTPYMNITDITVAGTRTLDPSLVRLKVLESLNTSYLLVVPKSTPLTLSKQDISQRILASYPQVKNVEIERSLMHGLTVTIMEHDMFARWCDTAESISCYVVNSDGLIFNTDTQYDPKLTIVGGIQTELGNQLMIQKTVPKKYMDTLVRFSDDLNVVGLIPTYVTIGSDGKTRVDTNGVSFIIRADEDPERVGRFLKNTIDEFTKNGVLEKIDYIDLRTQHRVFYTEKE